jgi:hypothetical protein
VNAQRFNVDWTRGEPAVVELDGPSGAYFEIPLDYWATPNGELEAENHPEASRLTQRVTYVNFKVGDRHRALTVVARVTARLKELGGGYIWWRLRPTATEDGAVRLRLGTTPELPADWWIRVHIDVDNQSIDQHG